MTTFSGNVPSANTIMTILASLYADQCGVEAAFSMESEVENDERKTSVH